MCISLRDFKEHSTAAGNHTTKVTQANIESHGDLYFLKFVMAKTYWNFTSHDNFQNSYISDKIFNEPHLFYPSAVLKR